MRHMAIRCLSLIRKRIRRPARNRKLCGRHLFESANARGDFVSITEGLKAGDVVVSTGVFKLRNGMTVTINNDLAPKPQLNPTPADS